MNIITNFLVPTGLSCVAFIILRKALWIRRTSLIKPTDKVQLRFDKTFPSDYIVSFYNPIYREWWILPSRRLLWDKSKGWSLTYRGYIEPRHNRLTCPIYMVDNWCYKLSTIKDLQLYFDKLNDDYMKDLLNHEEKIRKQQPQVIFSKDIR